MCGCFDKKLPHPNDLDSEISELLDIFNAFEMNELDKAKLILNSLEHSPNRKLGLHIFCLYTQEKCEKIEIDTLDAKSIFVKAIECFVTKDTIGLYRFKQPLLHLSENFEHGFIFNFYYDQLMNSEDNQYSDIEIENFNWNKKDYSIIDICNMMFMCNHLYYTGKEQLLSAILNIILNTLSSESYLEKYPHLTNTVLYESLKMILLSNDEKKIKFCLSLLNRNLSYLPVGLWKQKVNARLLKFHVVPSSPEGIFEFLEKEIKSRNDLSTRYKSEVYTKIAYPVYEKSRILAQSLYSEVVNLNQNTPCISFNLPAIEFLTNIYIENGDYSSCKNLLDNVKSCTNLQNYEELTLARSWEKYYQYLCLNKDDMNACKNALLKKTLQDSIINAEYENEDELHLSDYLALAASDKFLYFQKMETQLKDTSFKNYALDEIQKTKYRIFNYRNNYSNIFTKKTLKKLRPIEKEIDQLTVSLNKYENFDGPIEDYSKMVQLQIEKLHLSSQEVIKYEKKKVAVRPISKIQNQLHSTNSQAIEFYQYEDALRIFVMNPDTFYHEPIVLDSMLDASVSALKQYQRFPQSDNIALSPIRAHLYKALFAKHIDTSFQNLIIIPDGILNGISFETLLSENERPLVEAFNISYAFGISAASDWTSEKKDIHKASFLSFTSDETLKDRNMKDYVELPGAEKEVNKCAALLSTIDTKVFTGSACTEKNIHKALLSDIAHIATHAVSDPKNSIGNYFITRTKKGTQKTYGYEFNNMETKSTLAVLSACETGIGKFEAGEGVFSLSRNLQQAGIPSVIKTLWKVDDENSHYLMEYFYKYLSEGNYLSQALQKAKIEYQKYHNTDPYFWSGYVLEGNPYTSFEMK